MLTMPTRSGWMVTWYTGEVKEVKHKNGDITTKRLKDEFCSTSKDEVESKKKELENQGFEIEMLAQCIF